MNTNEQGNNVAATIPSWDNRHTSPARSGSSVLPDSVGGGGSSSGGTMHGGDNATKNSFGVGKGGTGGFAEPGNTSSMSRRRASIIEGDKVTSTYVLVPPDGTNGKCNLYCYS